MSTGLREIIDTDLDEAIERVLVPRLGALLAARTRGHCMRVTDLTSALGVRLCRRLRTAIGDGVEAYVLGQPPEVAADVAVTSTKLVELRNPDAKGRQRSPLLVFIPPGTHASAEDSFGVATFEEAVLGDVYGDLAARLLSGIPDGLRQSIEEVFEVVEEHVREKSLPRLGSLERARFLLTVSLNDNDTDAAGAALFELGLIPDFELFADAAHVRTRVTRNARQMQTLNRADRPTRQRVIDLHLTDPQFRARLAEFLVQTGLDEARSWTRRIVIDRTNWGLGFHRWPLPEERPAETVHIDVDELDLPRAGDMPDHAVHSVLRNITGQPYLLSGAAGRTQMPVSFEVAPDPRRVAGLAKFAVQLVSEESGPTGVHGIVRVSTTARSTYKATLKKLRGAHLEDGWHFIRVLPLDADNIPLPVEHSSGADRHDVFGSGASEHAENESVRFYVISGDDLDEPPPPQGIRTCVGVTQELRRLEFAELAGGRDWRAVACKSSSWKGPDHATVEVSFGAHGVAEVAVAPVLADLERAILAEPHRISPRRICTVSGQQPVVVPAKPGSCPPSSEPWNAFLQARTGVMEAISGENGMVVAGRNLIEVREKALAYAEAYGELLTWHMRQAERTDSGAELKELAALLQIDTVVVDHRDARGVHSELTLVAPTQPLRLLWLVTWAELGERWLIDAAESSPEAVAAASETLSSLQPTGFPLVVPREDGRLSVAAEDLGIYWGVCLPTEAEDPQALLSDVAVALRMPDRRTGAITIPATRLADHLERYVRMHPYVRTLVICAVNAGRAEHLADMLIELERRKNLRHLAYDVRIFATDPQAPGSGEALAELLRGEWTTVAEAEAFATPAGTAGHAKLAVAVRSVDEFRSATSRHTAHVTLLFDAFSGEGFGVGPGVEDSPPPVHGLIQQMSVEYVDDGDTVAWHKQPRHGRPRDLHGAEELSDLLATLPATISKAAGAVSTGQVGTGLIPRITLSLTAEDSTLLHQAHLTSDWVITVDRTLGVEYFDSPTSLRRPDYVIDFASDGTRGLGHNVVVSSRSVDELRALLTPMIAQHGLQIDHRHAGTFFDQLRLLSGRLAFKIASTAPNQRTEVLGLALARLYLDYQGVLSDQILVPLDAHLELYREARRRADDVAESVALRRTDLALLSLDAARRTITCRLVEVKCYSALGGIGDTQKLRDHVSEQLNRSAGVLAEHFDPAHTQPDRPDRTVRNAELANLVRYYLGRAVRHGILGAEPANEARWLLDHLDWGYRLEFSRTGLIFDFSSKGCSSDSEGGIEFHHIGRDLVEELIGVLSTDPVLAAGQSTATLTSLTLARSAVTMPRLAEAAFRAPARSHHLPEENPRRGTDLDAPDAPPAGEESPGEAEPTPATPEKSRGPASPAAEAAPHAAAALPPVAPPLARPGTVTPVGDVGSTDIYLGSAKPSPQYGILGEVSGRRLALDLNETHTISLFGVQGGGKSYTLGSIIEAASLATPPANHLPHPLATIVFHYSSTLDYAPEFTSMVMPNDDADQVRLLRERYGAEPAGLNDVVMLVPEDQLQQRRAEYPSIEIRPLKFGSSELRATHWRFLMGAVGNQSTYIRQLGRIMKANRNRLSLDVIRDGIAQSQLSDTIKQLAQQRLDLAADYIDDSLRIGELVRPGRMIIVDLRDELIEKDEALGLFVVLMELFAEATSGGERFNKLVVFDEAHKYIESPDLVTGLIESVREMRHKGMNILVASQDPPSVPISLIELSNHVIMHKFNSPAWLKHIQKANAALADLTPSKMTALTPGEAYIWSSKATDAAFTRGAVKVRLRPRITRHGGVTKTAVQP